MYVCVYEWCWCIHVYAHVPVVVRYYMYCNIGQRALFIFGPCDVLHPGVPSEMLIEDQSRRMKHCLKRLHVHVCELELLLYEHFRILTIAKFD